MGASHKSRSRIGEKSDSTGQGFLPPETENDEHRYRRFFENANVGTFITRVTDGMLLDANRRMAVLLGFEDSKDIIGSIKLADHYVDPEARKRILTNARAVGEVSEEEVQLRRKDGQQRWVRLSAIHNRDEDCLEGTCVDITQRKAIEQEKHELERQYLHAQRMEAVGRLAGGLAHDFNNLLCAIKGNTSLALGCAVDPSLKELLDEVDLAADRGASLTRQLLTFSRKQVVTYEVLDLTELLRGLERMLVRLIGEDIHLQALLGKGPCYIHADRRQIEQVFVNLVVNARDSMPQGGKLTIELKRQGSEAAVVVRDRGCGMDAQTLAKVFEPFFTTKKPGLGTGLGLATVRTIIERHGGKVDVSSLVGKGSAFTITVPLVEQTSAALTERPPPPTLSGRERVLVVEDDDLVRTVTVRVLKRYGYHVLAASSGPEALNVARKHDAVINLLLTDVIMPEMNGLEVASLLVVARPYVKVLFTSGYSPDVLADRHGDLPKGMQLLTKPYTPNQLLSQVREALDGLE